MSNSTNSHREAARQRQFKHRLCVAMVVMGIALAVCFAATWWAARTAIRDIKEAEGRYSWRKSGWIESLLPDWRSSWRDGIGDVVATDANVTIVKVRGPHADNQLMSRLSKLPNLIYVEVDNGSITDTGLSQLAQGSSITHVEFSNTAAISDAGLAQLKSPPLLRLWITGSAIDGSGIAGLTSVGSLNVARCARFNDASLAELHRLKRLGTLGLSSTGVTNAGMEHLTHFSNLKDIHLDFTAVDDAGLITVVRTCPRLERISLIGTAVTETGFAELANLTSLKYVYIKHGTIPQSALSALKSALPAVTIRER